MRGKPPLLLWATLGATGALLWTLRLPGRIGRHLRGVFA